MKKKNLYTHIIDSSWTFSLNPKAKALTPKWYHKLEFWNKWWKWGIKREYKSLKEFLNETAGK